MNKIRSTIFLIFILILTAGINRQASAYKYKPLTKTQIADLFQAPKRFVLNLSGKWEMSDDNETWKTTYIPGVHSRNNKIYLRRTIKIDKKIADRFNWELYFLGVDENIEIYLNGQFVGKYIGAMTPFTVNLPKRFLLNNNNEIKFIITAASGAEGQIKRQNVFMKRIYTGILRDLFLIGNPKVFLNNIVYITKPGKGGWNVKATAAISSGDISAFISKTRSNDSLDNIGIVKTKIRIEGQIINKKTGMPIATFTPRSIDVESFRTVNLDFLATVYAPKLWSPDNPSLYTLRFKIIRKGILIDQHSVNLGFVAYSVKKNEHLSQLYVNGKKTQIKGVTYIENFADGKAISYAELARDILRIKMNLGANLIKIKYGSPSPLLLQLCDKYGLMVLTELPLYDVPQSMYNLDEIKVKMRNLADRYLNTYSIHPSIAAWGIFDGVNDIKNSSTTDYLVAVFKKHSNKLIYKTVRFGIKAINTKGVDFIGLRDNRKFHSIETISDELIRLNKLAGDKPIFVEYGFPIKPDNHNGYSDPLSLEALAYYILNLYHIVENQHLMGNIIFTYKDYYLENPLLIVNNKNLYLCSAGLVDIYGKQRISFNTLKTLFNNEKEPLMNSGSYSESTPVSYIIIGLLFTVLIVFYINRYKRFREYFLRAFVRPYNFFADIRDQRIISNLQTIILAFILVLTIGLYLSSIIYFFRTDTVNQLILILLIPTKALREFFFTIAWSPELLLLTITLFFFIQIFIIAGLLRLFAQFVRSKIFYKDTLTIVVWSAVPFVFLLPFSILITKIIVFSPALTWVIFLVLGLFTLWTLQRILKAIGIVFDTHPTKTYIIGSAVIVFIVVIILSIYQFQYSIFYYTEYIFQTLLG